MTRPSLAFLLLVSLGVTGLVVICIRTSHLSPEARSLEEHMKSLVIRYGLTDLCIFTEARYTRHPSVADLHSAFQDHPGALDHFPTGSFVSPPTHLRHPPWSSLPSTPQAETYHYSDSHISSRIEFLQASPQLPRIYPPSIPWTPSWRPQAGK